jgi:hypothetical protein
LNSSLSSIKGLSILIFIIVPYTGVVIYFDPSLIGIYYIIAIPILIIYGLYPIRFRTENHFMKRGYDVIVTEVSILKKIFLFEMSIFVLILVILNLFINLESESHPVYIYSSSAIVAFLGIGLRICTLSVRSEFYLYYARGCCLISSKKEDVIEKAKYFWFVLDSYNKYLKRHLKFKIKDLEGIYSKFLSAETQERYEVENLACKSLEGDRLELARYIATFYKVPESDLFVNESLVERLRLKSIGTIIATAIPIAISIIQLTMQ